MRPVPEPRGAAAVAGAAVDRAAVVAVAAVAGAAVDRAAVVAVAAAAAGASRRDTYTAKVA